MAQKGISKDIIFTKAIEMIERNENPAISMRELAEELEIKTPSLYNHVKSMNELFVDISCYAAERLKQAQLAAIKGKHRDDALFALATAYRSFAKEHKGLYKVTICLPTLQGDILTQTAAAIAEPIFLVFSQYELSEEQSIHWQRILRSIIHGFLTQEEAGFFKQYPVSVEISYQIAIRCFLTGLHAEIEENNNAEQRLPVL